MVYVAFWCLCQLKAIRPMSWLSSGESLFTRGGSVDSGLSYSYLFFFSVSSPFHTMTYFVACDPFSLGRPKRVWVSIALLAHRRRWSLVPLSPLHIRNIFQWWFQLFSLLLGLPGTSIWNTTQAYSIYLMPWGKWYCPLWTHIGRKLDP